MSMTLLSALQTNNATTENGMPTNSSTLNHCVDLFSQIGAMRGQDTNRLINAFVKAYEEDNLVAMKILFWARDIRGGSGERKIFRDIIKYLSESRTEVIAKNLALVSVFGRWDDLLSLVGTPLETQALTLVSNALKAKDGLCAKWVPRPNVKNTVKKAQANALRKFMDLSPKEFRKMLAEYSKTVEQLMCAKKYDAIQYDKLPSKAMSNYMKAFSKNDLSRFQAYLAAVSKGEAKINAGAVYPYDIVKNMRYGSSKGADVQWKALPNFMEGNKERLLPMVDVSGSMTSHRFGTGATAVSAFEIAVSLGLYISERNVGPYKDAFITFTSKPTLQILKGSLSERYSQMTGPVGYDTNLEAAFMMVLKHAVANKVAESEMPTMIVVLSDMEFNDSNVGGLNAQQMIKSHYEAAGYKMPTLVYWNLASRSDKNKPVQYNEKGTALISGFSPSILMSLLAAKSMTPYTMMMDTLNSERYADITV